MTRVLLVANRASGGAGDTGIDEIADAIRPLGSVQTCVPSSKDTFDREIRAGAQGASLVVVAGGDGTFNCAVNALEDSISDLTFGLVPMGTGNDLARTLGIGDDPLRAAAGLADGSERTIDVGRISGAGGTRLFVNACMGGWPVAVDEHVDPATKKRLGPLAFWLGGLKAAPHFHRSVVTINGVEVPDCVAVGIGNGKTCGGGMKVWPDADPDDGLLNACALPASNPAAAVRLAAKVKFGTHEEIEAVTTLAASEITIAADPPIELNVDGELEGINTTVTAAAAGKLRIRTPSL